MAAPKDFNEAISQLRDANKWDQDQAVQFAAGEYHKGNPKFTSIPGIQQAIGVPVSAEGGESNVPSATTSDNVAPSPTPTWLSRTKQVAEGTLNLATAPGRQAEQMFFDVGDLYSSKVVEPGAEAGTRGFTQLLTKPLGERGGANVGEALGNVERGLAYGVEDVLKIPGWIRDLSTSFEADVARDWLGRSGRTGKGLGDIAGSDASLPPVFESPKEQPPVPAPAVAQGYELPNGIASIEEGKPFEGKYMVPVKGRGGSTIYYDHRSPTAIDFAKKGVKPGKFAVQNPKLFTVDTPGEEGLREALRQAYADDPSFLHLIDNTPNIRDVGQELLGRWALANKFDSVAIKPASPEDNLLFDFKDFKTQSHPEIVKASKLPVEEATRTKPRARGKRGALSGGNAKVDTVPAQDPSLKQLPDERYHGSPQPIDSILNHYSTSATVYGSGLHTTSNYRIANGYAGSGEGATLYRITEKEPGLKFLDLESPIEDHPDKENILRVLAGDPFGREIFLHDRPVTFRQWYDAVRDRIVAEVPDAVDAGRYRNYFDQINYKLQQLGYSGLDHLGGNIRPSAGVKGKPLLHNVRIYWTPSDDVNLERIVEGMEPKSVNQAWKDAHTELKGEPTDHNHLMRQLGTDGPEALGPDITRAIKDSGDVPKLRWAAKFRFVMNASNHPGYRAWIGKLFQVQSYLFGKESRRMGNILKRIVEGMSPEDFDEMAYAVQGYKRSDDLKSLEQTRPDIRPEINEKARQWRTRITDRLYTLLTGNHPHTYSIMEQHKLPHKRVEFERLRLIQEYQALKDAGDTKTLPPFKYSTSESVAAGRLKGMLNFDDSHDLDIKIGEGFFPINPIENERAYLESLLNGDTDFTDLGLIKSDTKAYKDWGTRAIARLQELERQAAADEIARLPNRDNLPQRHYSKPISTARRKAVDPLKYSTDMAQVGSDHIMTSLNKRFNDIVLAETRKFTSKYPKMPGDMRDYITQYVQTTRGVTGYRADRWIANILNGIPGLGEWDHADVHRFADDIMRMMFITKLRLTPLRFPLINLTHILMTVGPEGMYVTAKNFFKVLAHTDRYFKRAMSDGIINPTTQYLIESGSRELGMLQRRSNLSRLFTQLGRPIPDIVKRAYETLNFFTEKLRFVVANEVAKEQFGKYLESGDKSYLNPAAVTYIDRMKGRNAVTATKEYARAFVDATQFRAGIENKPLYFSAGGSATRMASQFKTWQFGLTSYTGRILRSGDVRRSARLMAAIVFLGGPGAFTGYTVYDFLRRELLKEGIKLPEGTGLEWLFSQFGLDFEIPSLRDPFGVDQYYRMPAEQAADALGPAPSTLLDPFIQQFEKWAKEGGFPDVDTGMVVDKFLGPQVKAAAEAVGETGQGGMFGPTGTLEVNRPWMARFMRGMDLTIGSKQIRRNYQEDLAAAKMSGDSHLQKSILEDAKSRGVIIDQKFIQGAESTYRRYRRTEMLKRAKARHAR